MMWWWIGGTVYGACALVYARVLFNFWEVKETDVTGALIALAEGLLFPLTTAVIAMLYYITRPIPKKTKTKG